MNEWINEFVNFWMKNLPKVVEDWNCWLAKQRWHHVCRTMLHKKIKKVKKINKLKWFWKLIKENS